VGGTPQTADAHHRADKNKATNQVMGAAHLFAMDDSIPQTHWHDKWGYALCRLLLNQRGLAQ